ncbi:MAG: S8 family serine peptidase [Holophagales bacterium]|jgi:thermitase|nr:S8 family serine peptidase [Holophagales bacterium]
MFISKINYYSLTLASLLALGLACGSNPQDGPGEPNVPPIKDIPVVTEPPVKYNFYEPRSEEGLMNDTNYGYLIAKARPGFKTAHFERLGFEVIGSMAANGAIYYRLHKDCDVMSAFLEAKKHAGLVYIEPEIKHKLHDVEANPVTLNNLDRLLAEKSAYSPYTIQAIDAWVKYGFGNPSNKPIVASVDSGVRWRHEDLLAQVKHAFSWYTPRSTFDDYIWTDHVQLAGGRIPLDAERLLSLLPDFTRQYNGSKWYTTDTQGHGTHTSATIAATGNNGVGIAGVSWNNELIHYKGFASSGEASNWSIYGSIWHLARWKEVNNYTATIPVNYSLGGPIASQFALDMIAHGLQNGIVVVASAGNEGQRMVQYPAAFSGVIAVGATNSADRLASFSNWGSHVSVAAPGESIISAMIGDERASLESVFAYSNNSYAMMSGTSMAAPHVTGLIGYMLNFNPSLKPDQIKTYIEKNADYVDGKTGFSDEYGWGRINVLKTIEAVINDANNGTTPSSNYAMSPVKVKAPINGLNVYLYNCSSDGAIENYVASSITGDYMTGAESSVAWFNMLRPGRYIAKAHMGFNQVASTQPFNVEASMAPLEVSLAFAADMLTIQTFYTRDFINTDGADDTDTCIELWDSQNNLIVRYDSLLMDSLVFPEPSTPGAYYIRIYEYMGDDMKGEYALWFTNGPPWAPDDPNDYVTTTFADGTVDRTPIAPGTYANPLPANGSAKSLHAQTSAAAQALDRRVIYYGRFNDASGTSGATGHWYKFVVE